MDGCSLSDAFPSGAFASAGCIDKGTAEESRRQEKKKARKCRGPALTYLNSGMNNVGAVDPDRPSTKRMEPVPALNEEVGLTSHNPVTQQYEFFVGSNECLPTNQETTQTVPSFFGADPVESSCTPATKSSLTENFKSSVSPFVDIIGKDDSYKLEPDFATTFDMSGAQKAGGSTNIDTKAGAYLTPTKMTPSGNLPYPNLDMFWKENGLAGGQSSFFSKLKSPSGEPERDNQQSEEHMTKSKEVLHKLDRIFARLDDIDAMKSENSQTEVLLFILTGLGVIFLMDIGCRVATLKRY
jgi:hypothetical protein